jgi:hypothetical protein
MWPSFSVHHFLFYYKEEVLTFCQVLPFWWRG